MEYPRAKLVVKQDVPLNNGHNISKEAALILLEEITSLIPPNLARHFYDFAVGTVSGRNIPDELRLYLKGIKFSHATNAYLFCVDRFNRHESEYDDIVITTFDSLVPAVRLWTDEDIELVIAGIVPSGFGFFYMLFPDDFYDDAMAEKRMRELSLPAGVIYDVDEADLFVLVDEVLDREPLLVRSICVKRHLSMIEALDNCVLVQGQSVLMSSFSAKLSKEGFPCNLFNAIVKFFGPNTPMSITYLQAMEWLRRCLYYSRVELTDSNKEFYHMVALVYRRLNSMYVSSSYRVQLFDVLSKLVPVVRRNVDSGVLMLTGYEHPATFLKELGIGDQEVDILVRSYTCRIDVSRFGSVISFIDADSDQEWFSINSKDPDRNMLVKEFLFKDHCRDYKLCDNVLLEVYLAATAAGLVDIASILVFCCQRLRFCGKWLTSWSDKHLIKTLPQEQYVFTCFPKSQCGLANSESYSYGSSLPCQVLDDIILCKRNHMDYLPDSTSYGVPSLVYQGILRGGAFEYWTPVHSGVQRREMTNFFLVFIDAPRVELVVSSSFPAHLNGAGLSRPPVILTYPLWSIRSTSLVSTSSVSEIVRDIRNLADHISLFMVVIDEEITFPVYFTALDKEYNVVSFSGMDCQFTPQYATPKITTCLQYDQRNAKYVVDVCGPSNFITN